MSKKEITTKIILIDYFENRVGFAFNYDDLEKIEKIINFYEDNVRQLKEQLDFVKLDFPEMNSEHFRILNENKRKIDNLRYQNKQLKEQLQISKEVIEECKQSIENFMTYIDDDFCADMMTFIDILNKYKKEES